ncbi:hypothetical protein L1787_01220 [Acuticoccus sp. M5D2P5]|uniref:hypothetical protein n=1 Tax=Acuticoccus kalidii TaxID=2910977 RepID=UPI001F3EC723|nr:hypothetical protein [Acuticoccus kalidii]MCF3932033.1 hypothetical protein [Acuticoccus kalidii]
MDTANTTPAPHRRDSLRRLVLRELPYLTVLLLILGGVAYSSMMRAPLETYWALVAVVNCGACIVAGWHYASGRKGQMRLVVTQILHWGAFLAVMGLVFLPSVQSVATADGTSLIIMLLLALGTFVAGVHTTSWRMGLNGIIMALFVPAVAWLDQSALLIALGVVVVALIVAGFVVFTRSRHHLS